MEHLCGEEYLLLAAVETFSMSMVKMRSPERPTHVLFVMMSKTGNNGYDWSHVRVRALGSQSPI